LTLAVAGDDLFVANGGSVNGLGGSVTKLNASTGASVWVAPEHKVDDPAAVAVAGNDVFVADGYGDSVTELNASTGAPVRVISAPAYKFDVPDAMAVAGGDLFVANYKGNSVTELPM
jgi:outer membrane protein assembly factor BamB